MIFHYRYEVRIIGGFGWVPSHCFFDLQVIAQNIGYKRSILRMLRVLLAQEHIEVEIRCPEVKRLWEL